MATKSPTTPSRSSESSSSSSQAHGFKVGGNNTGKGGFGIDESNANHTISSSRGGKGTTGSAPTNGNQTSAGPSVAAKAGKLAGQLSQGGPAGIAKGIAKDKAMSMVKGQSGGDTESLKDQVKDKVKQEAKAEAKKAVKQVGKQAGKAAARGAMALLTNPITWLVLLAILLITFVIFVVVYFWKHPAQALKISLSVVASSMGLGVNSTIEGGGASQLAYEVPVSGAGTAQAAVSDYNPATAPTAGTYAYAMSKIDWEKAKYKTVANISNCDVLTKKVASPDGSTRSVVDKVVIKSNVGDGLSGIAKANCIDKTYPIFNAVIRSQFIRDGINAQIGIRYAYATPKDSTDFNGKTNEEVETMLRNKSLDRIWKQSGGKVGGFSEKAPEKTVDNCGREPDQISEVRTKNDELCAGRVELFAYQSSDRYTEAIQNCANAYNFQNAPDLDVAIEKAKLDLACGIPPEELIYYYNLPDESLAKTGDDSIKSIQSKVHILRTICKINEYSLKDDPIAEETYRDQVEKRIASEINAAIQAMTYADTTQDRFLSIQDLSGDAYKVLGMGNSQEYNHTVNGDRNGVPTDSDALSRIFGIANLKAYKPGETIYNDASTQAALKVLNRINTVTGEEPQSGQTKPLCDILNSKNFNDIYYPEKGEVKTAEKLKPQVSDFFDNYYPDFKQALATLDAYSKDQKGKPIDKATALSSIRINDILKRYVNINANVSTAGTEDGLQNFNRMSTGMQAYKNSVTLAMGGKFLNPNEAVLVENQTRSMIAYQDRINGIGWRLFDTKNPSSITSRLAVAFIDKPNRIVGNIGNVIGNLFNPAKNLIGGRSSLAYSLTGESHIAEAATSYEINNLRLDPAGIPDGFYTLDSFKNAAAVEAIIKSNPSVAGTFLGWEKCFREFIPSQFHLIHPDDDKVALYKDFCRELYDVNAPTKLANPGILQSIISNPTSINFSNPAVRSDISFMYRAFHFYNIQAQALTYLSDPTADDESLNAREIQAIEYNGEAGETPDIPAGGAVGADTSAIPCPPGTSDAGVKTKYGPNKVPQHQLRVCNVQGITVNVSIATNVNNLLNAARASGVSLGGWGFRTYERQVELRTENGCPDLTSSASTCDTPTAVPGKSNHENGEAIDFTQGGSTIGRGSSGFKWLQSNAATYGLKNLPSEAWHWSVTGG